MAPLQTMGTDPFPSESGVSHSESSSEGFLRTNLQASTLSNPVNGSYTCYQHSDGAVLYGKYQGNYMTSSISMNEFTNYSRMFLLIVGGVIAGILGVTSFTGLCLILQDTELLNVWKEMKSTAATVTQCLL